jgi:hypothetical protein
MSAGAIVVVSVGPEDPAKMHFAQNHDLIQAFSPDRADQPLHMPILPRRPRCGWSIPDAHRPESVSDDGPIGTVSVADEVSGCLFPWEGLGDLTGDPFRRRVASDVGPDQAASLKMDNRQPIEQLEADGRNDERIASRDVRGVIAKEGLPGLATVARVVVPCAGATVD